MPKSFSVDDEIVVTQFPEAAELLPVWLADLGKVKLGMGEVIVSLEIACKKPLLVRNSREEHLPDGIYIASLNRAVYGSHGMFQFGKIPLPGAKVLYLHVNLSLSGRYYPVEQHTLEIMEKQVRNFAKAVLVGITYDFEII